MPQSTKPPAFQFYPKDWLSDSNVVRMPFAAKGMYIDLLCVCWMDGVIPSDTAELAALLRSTVDDVKASYPHLEKCFKAARRKPGFWVHPRLDVEREKQLAYTTRQREHGRRGGLARQNSTRDGSKVDGETSRTDNDLPRVASVSPQANSSSSSSSPSSSPEREIPSGISHPSKFCPPDWKPSEITMRMVSGRVQPGVDVDRELLVFRSHEFQYQRSDWDAAFTKWCLQAKPRGAAGEAPAQRPKL